MRFTKFILCNCKELDLQHNHSLYFTDKNKQLEYFLTKKVFTINECQYHRKDGSIRVEKTFDELSLVNYVLTRNEENGKYYFYFVYDRVYVSDYVTQLILKLDVIQTYLFDMDFTSIPSLIERTHLNVFNSQGEVIRTSLGETENLEVGEYIKYNKQTLYDYSEKGGYIVASSTKLTANNGGSNTNSGNSFKSGYVSENGFVLIKSMEAFASAPYDIGDGTRTIGYGVTEKYNEAYFNSLLPTCTEQQASEVFGKLLYDNYSKYVYSQFKAYNINLDNVKQHEFDAFVSFYYNHGQLTNKKIWIDYVNGVDKNSIYKTWLTTVIMEGSAYEQGLRDRRLREATCFRDGQYNFKQIQNITSGGYITDNDGKGYIPDTYKSSGVDTTLGSKIVESARKIIGKPYVWGGNYPPLGSDNGTDCSGLCQWAYNDNGVIITRTTYTQIKEGKEITKAELQLGDLVFTNFSSPGVPEHVYIYSGTVNGELMCIEAPRTGLNTRERAFTWESSTRARRLL